MLELPYDNERQTHLESFPCFWNPRRFHYEEDNANKEVCLQWTLSFDPAKVPNQTFYPTVIVTQKRHSPFSLGYYYGHSHHLQWLFDPLRFPSCYGTHVWRLCLCVPLMHGGIMMMMPQQWQEIQWSLHWSRKKRFAILSSSRTIHVVKAFTISRQRQRPCGCPVIVVAG